MRALSGYHAGMTLWLAALGCGASEAPHTTPLFGAGFLADLDGDKSPETVHVEYEQVHINELSISVPKIQIHEPPVVVLDIDQDDPYKELAVQAVDASGHGSWHILLYENGHAELESIEVTTPPEVLGDGVLRTRYTNCGETTVTDWARADGRMTQTRTETIGMYNVALCSG